MAYLSCSQDAFINWRERGYLFGAEFRDHVENTIMKRTPHPLAKPMGAFSIAPGS